MGLGSLSGISGRGYPDTGMPRSLGARTTTIHHIRHLSTFDLSWRTWGLGSMFFVADVTSDRNEFELAVRSFLGSLTPGAPFMMAFMEKPSATP